MILSLLGMIFSFVRASWLGFFGGLILILLLRNKWNLSKLKFNFFYKIIYSFFFFGLILFISSPSFNSIIKNRFTTKGLASISISNFRFVMGEYAFKSFLKHPIIGNGPGSPLVREGTKEYHEAIETEQAYIIEGNFNPGLLTTLLKDTGIIGTLVFLFLFAKFFRYNLRNIPRLENHYQVISFAFFCGIFGLFISFLLTHGFWMPFTWVFLGFNIVSIRMGLKDKGA
jgi:O-antigen ligase